MAGAELSSWLVRDAVEIAQRGSCASTRSFADEEWNDGERGARRTGDIRGVTLTPGEWLYADADGIVVQTASCRMSELRSFFKEVRENARTARRKSEDRSSSASGRSPPEYTERAEVLAPPFFDLPRTPL